MPIFYVHAGSAFSFFIFDLARRALVSGLQWQQPQTRTRNVNRE
jgi:hypothetical protein